MERNPMRFWSGKTKGFAQFDGDRFGFRLDVPDGMAKTLYAWMREVCARCARGVREVCEYQLHGSLSARGRGNSAAAGAQV